MTSRAAFSVFVHGAIFRRLTGRPFDGSSEVLGLYRESSCRRHVAQAGEFPDNALLAALWLFCREWPPRSEDRRCLEQTLGAYVRARILVSRSAWHYDGSAQLTVGLMLKVLDNAPAGSDEFIGLVRWLWSLADEAHRILPPVCRDSIEPPIDVEKVRALDPEKVKVLGVLGRG